MQNITAEMVFRCTLDNVNSAEKCDASAQGRGGVGCRHNVFLGGLSVCENRRVHELLMYQEGIKHLEKFVH